MRTPTQRSGPQGPSVAPGPFQGCTEVRGEGLLEIDPKGKAKDLDDLTEAIKAGANQKIGGELVRQVLIQQLNYVRKEDIRTHWIKK